MITFKILTRLPVLVPLCLVLLFSRPAGAAIFVVADTNDTTRVTSLRGAIIAANRIGGKNTIVLGWAVGHRREPRHQWIYRLTISGADEDAARTGDLDITRGSLTITGASPNVTIDATGLGDRVFQVFSNAHLTLSHLTITGGTAPLENGPGSEAYGGAIFNSGTLRIEDCFIVANSSGNGWYWGGFALPGGNGGGIYKPLLLLRRDARRLLACAGVRDGIHDVCEALLETRHPL